MEGGRILTEEEKEKLMRQEMMEKSAWRYKEGIRTVKKYREKEEKEKKEQNFDHEFIHKQCSRSADIVAALKVKSKPI